MANAAIYTRLTLSRLQTTHSRLLEAVNVTPPVDAVPPCSLTQLRATLNIAAKPRPVAANDVYVDHLLPSDGPNASPSNNAKFSGRRSSQSTMYFVPSSHPIRLIGKNPPQSKMLREDAAWSTTKRILDWDHLDTIPKPCTCPLIIANASSTFCRGFLLPIYALPLTNGTFRNEK